MAEMNLSRHISVFNPKCVDAPIHIIGVGATGSFVAMQLARMGVSELYLYDFDEVEIHNIPNQYYDNDDLGKTKVDALAEKLSKINPELVIHKNIGKVVPVDTEKDDEFGINKMSGYVFLLVDSMAARKELFGAIKTNENIKHYWESRLGSKQGTVYYFPINKELDYSIYETAHFYSDEQAEVSACGTSITVLPIVLMTSALMIEQFIKVVMQDEDPEAQLYNYTIFNAVMNCYQEKFFEKEEVSLDSGGEFQLREELDL